MEQFTTGAKRSERQSNHFHLIPSEPLRRLARRYALGTIHYGEYNWMKGFPFSDLFNHIQDHLENVKQKYESVVLASQSNETEIRLALQEILSDSTDDDLAGAAWGIFAIMELARIGHITPDNGWNIPADQSATQDINPVQLLVREYLENDRLKAASRKPRRRNRGQK